MSKVKKYTGSNASNRPAPFPASPATSPPPPPPPLPPGLDRMFTRTDWLSALLTTVIVMIGYMATLAPNVTLEDSGELSVASQYAGVPHPPGYPVWTLYTWLFTVILPFGNIAWRVGVSSAFAGAVSCGLIALMVSRGSCLIIGGLEEFKNLSARFIGTLGLVAGFVGGSLMAFNGFYWSQAVIVEVYTLSVLSLMVTLVFLMRWVYSPERHRYLYAAMFAFGICFTNHQTLIVAAMGIEITVAAVNRRLGRALFLGNGVIYALTLLIKAKGGLSNFDGNPPLFVIFNLIGIGSLYAFWWLGNSLRIGTKVTLLVGHFAFALILLMQWAGGAISDAFFPLVMLLWGPGVIGVVYGMMKMSGNAESVLTSWREEWKPVLMMGLLWIVGAAFYFYMPVASMSNPPLNWGYPRTAEGFVHALTRGQYEKANPANLINDPMRFFSQIWMYAQGVLEEFNLGYVLLGLIPFAVIFYWRMKREELNTLLVFSGGYLLLCFVVALVDLRASKLFIGDFWIQNMPGFAGMGAGLVLLWITATPLVVTSHAQKREAAWMAGLISIYIFLALLLLVLLNPGLDRQSRDLNRVFFTSSHVIIAISIGLGTALLGAVVRSADAQFRKLLLGGAAVIGAVALYAATVVYGPDASLSHSSVATVLFGIMPTHDQWLRFTAVLGLVLVGLFVLAAGGLRGRAQTVVLLGLFALMPVRSFTAHWADNEQHGHLYGYWFGHDMFTPPFKDKDGAPLFPEMDRDTVLFGGTDPGRFNPTYMIFSESLTPREDRQAEDPDFDRRDVYLITQNALADGTYLAYIRAHYNRSTQKDPPFFTESSYTKWLGPVAKLLDSVFLRIGDNIEKDRRVHTSWFTPGSFTNVAALAKRLQPGQGQDAVSKFVHDALTPKTQALIAGGDEAALKKALAADLNVLLERELSDRKTPEFAAAPRRLFDAERFGGISLSARTLRFAEQNPQSHTRIRLNRILLDETYADAIAPSIGGVYPDLEILTPSPQDYEKSFSDYVQDAARRRQHDDQFPSEPRQMRPGEDVRISPDGRVQVQGQVAVMAINALLTKVIFDKNPDHAFYVEESFPLDWMFPHLTPYGVIMKINREPLPVLDAEVLRRDHEFWRQYGTRTVGDWITYETSVKEICDFAEKVYLRRDLDGFKGDPKFARDDNAQKAFSKLRGGIAGIYAWRLGFFNGIPVPQEYLAREESNQRAIAMEAEFAFKQSFAMCPYSAETVFRYVNFLFAVQRPQDALLISETCLKLDPENAAIARLVLDLRNIKPVGAEEQSWKANSNDFQSGYRYANALLSQNRRPEALAVLDSMVANPAANAQTIVSAAEVFRQLGDWPRIEPAMLRLTQILPQSPEAWFDLAGVRAMLGKNGEALQALESAVRANDERLRATPQARDLRPNMINDPRFQNLRGTPEFQRLLPSGGAPPAAAVQPPLLPPPQPVPQPPN